MNLASTPSDGFRANFFGSNGRSGEDTFEIVKVNLEKYKKEITKF